VPETWYNPVMQKSYQNVLIVCLVVALGSFALGFGARHFSAQKPGNHRMWLASLTGGRGLSGSPSQTFSAVLESVEDSFVDRITDQRPLTYGALREMMDALDDPNSRFLDPEETRDMLEAEDGLFHGIGAVVHIEATHTAEGERRRAILANVLPGGPANAAGLRVGDVIVKIDDKWVYRPYTELKVAPRGEKVTDASPTEPAIPDTAEVEDFLVYSTQDILRPLSQDGKSLRLLLLGPGGKSLEQVTVETAPTSIRAAQVVKVASGVAEIRIAGFTRTTGPDLDAALAEARRQGARQVVLDMRGCLGGQTERAVQVASRFMDGPVGAVERKQGGANKRFTLTAHRTANAWTGPLAVLVDRSTLGSAELLAGALATKARATLVGARTFGDGLEHTVIPLRDGSSLLMTTGKFYAAGGEAYQAKGIAPGVAVASAPEQMNAARRLLAKKG